MKGHSQPQSIKHKDTDHLNKQKEDTYKNFIFDPHNPGFKRFDPCFILMPNLHNLPKAFSTERISSIISSCDIIVFCESYT